MSDEQDLTRSICSNLLKVVEQLQAASSTSSQSIRPAAAVTSELEHSASVLGRHHGLLPSVDLPSSSNPITRHRTRPSLGTELGSTADLVERQACTGGSSSHHDPGPPLNMSSQSHSEQLRQLFRSKTKLSPFDRKGKRRKLSDIVEDKLWKHQFLCLANKNQSTVPEATEKAVLRLAGLGEKSISLSATRILTEQLYVHFHQLRNAGGFELMRQGPNRSLELIPIPLEGYTVEYIHSVVPHAKIYIRPMQVNLNTDKIQSTSNVLQEKCMRCGSQVPLHLLKDHIYKCSDEKVEFDGLIDISEYEEEHGQFEQHGQSDDEEQFDNEERHGQCEKPPKSYDDIVRRLRLFKLSVRSVEVVVRRTHFIDDVLSYAAQEDFDPGRPIRVRFAGELGIDAGGVKREFFTLLESSVKPTYIDNMGCFTHNICALHENVYFRLGQLVAMSIVQGGSSFFVSPSTYKYIFGTSIKDIAKSVHIVEVGDTSVKDFLCKVTSVDSVEEFRKLYTENFSLLSDNGITKPFLNITLEDREEIRKMICLNHVITKSLAELQQFVSGLEALDVLQTIHNYPDAFQKFFICEQEKLSVEIMLRILSTVRYSEETEEREKEECAFLMFLDYIEETHKGLIHDEDIVLDLNKVLEFFTATNVVPPEGIEGSVSFSPDNAYPRGITCFNELILPTKFNGDYSTFKENMTTGILHHGGFGLP